MIDRKNFAEEMTWRGMLHDMMPETDIELNKGMVSGYIGFDPTADSLHVGHLMQIMTLIHFQQAGHKPYALVGGATGMVGDPSGKSAERNLLNEDTLNHNVEAIKQQLQKFLNFDAAEPNSAVMVNNYDWFKSFNFLHFIRDVGKHITVNYMMAKDSVKRRLEGDNGLSFTEFTYQLVQGYDFYYLWKHHGIKIQMGGSDQWGNIVTGTELIRRKDGGTAYALTTNLIKKSDGTKFGKTESGAIWLDSKKTSPYKFYQFWLNASDDDVKSWIRIFTLLTKAEIEALEAEHAAAPHLRLLQKALAKDITERVHGVAEYNQALSASNILFGNATTEAFSQLSEDVFLDIFEGVPQFNISKNELEQGIGLVDLLAEKTAVFSSKGEAKKMLQGGGVSINKEKIDDVNGIINHTKLINNKYMIVQKGKKNYFLIIAQENESIHLYSHSNNNTSQEQRIEVKRLLLHSNNHDKNKIYLERVNDILQLSIIDSDGNYVVRSNKQPNPRMLNDYEKRDFYNKTLRVDSIESDRFLFGNINEGWLFNKFQSIDLLNDAVLNFIENNQ